MSRFRLRSASGSSPACSPSTSASLAPGTPRGSRGLRDGRVVWVPLALSLLGCVPKSGPGTDAASPAAPQPNSPPTPQATGPSAAPQAKPLRIAFTDQPPVALPLGKLRRGINLGNGFDAPTLGAWGVTPDEKHFEMAAAVGLDHMRLPVRFSAHADKEAPYTIDEEFFQKIDWAIAEALERGLSIIVDLHHYEEIMKEPDAHADRLVGLWTQIAERYQDRPDTVLFELLNEPNDKLTPDKLNALMARLIAAVRPSNPTRTIIVDSYFWAAPDRLANLKLPEDEHVAASFHMYQPILFTHQGASWMQPEFQTRGIVFPGPPNVPATPTPAAAATPWTQQWIEAFNNQPAETNPSSPRAVAREFDQATRFAKERGIPVYLGEFGAIDIADPTSRENYLRLVRREAERRGFAWTVWDDGGRNMAMNVRAGTWVAPVARALFTEQPGEPLPENIPMGG